MARPSTLCAAAERIRAGVSEAVAVPEFLDEFYRSANPAARAAMLRDEPPLVANARLDALMGAICEYLTKQYALPGPMPAWAGGPARSLAEPWFTTSGDGDSAGMREYLAFASPAEFRHRNIFTEAMPLRRASQRRRDDDG